MSTAGGGLDLAKLKGLQKKIKESAGQGDGSLLFANKLPEELDVRLLPPRPEMNGVYFLEQTGWWIDGKFLLVDADNDVIQEEIDEALASGDKTLETLINKTNQHKAKVVKKEIRYALPILVLSTEFNGPGGSCSKCEVDSVKTLLAKPTLMMAINEVVTSRIYQNGTKDGIMDRVEGWNMMIGKSGKGLDTTYKAIGWNEKTEMPEKYYTDKELPNLMEDYRRAKKSDEHIRSVIRNYLYGEAIIEDSREEEDNNPTEKTRRSTTDAPRQSRTTAEKEKPVDTKRGDVPRTTRRSIVDDAESDLDDLD